MIYEIFEDDQGRSDPPPAAPQRRVPTTLTAPNHTTARETARDHANR